MGRKVCVGRGEGVLRGKCEGRGMWEGNMGGWEVLEGV